MKVKFQQEMETGAPAKPVFSGHQPSGEWLSYADKQRQIMGQPGPNDNEIGYFNSKPSQQVGRWKAVKI